MTLGHPSTASKTIAIEEAIFVLSFQKEPESSSFALLSYWFKNVRLLKLEFRVEELLL